MTSVGSDGKLWGKEGEDGASDSGSSSGMCQVSGGSEEFLADGDFFAGQGLALSGKPIAFSHIVSKTKDVSLQPRIVEPCNGSIDDAATGMGRIEDLEGIVSKETWFCEVWGGTRIGVEVARINLGCWALATFDLWVGRLDNVPDPSAGISRSFFFIIDSGRFSGEGVILDPPVCLHPVIVFVHDLSVIALLRTVAKGAGYPDFFKDDSTSLFFFRSSIFFIRCNWRQFMLDRVLRQFFSIGLEGAVKSRVVGCIMFVDVVAVFWCAR
jgi:hypothetical protein